MRGIDDDELAHQRQQRDQHHRAQLHDTVPALQHTQDRVAELKRDQHRHHHPEHRLEHLLLGRIDHAMQNEPQDPGHQMYDGDHYKR